LVRIIGNKHRYFVKTQADTEFGEYSVKGFRNFYNLRGVIMADNALLKEYRKARKGNILEADPAAMLVEVIEEVIKLRKDFDEMQTRLTALEEK
jgi:hypothetical protein